MNKIGYLSPTGKFFDCLAYGHLELARKICLRLYNETFDTKVNAEVFLLDKGWAMFQPYTVGFRFRTNNEVHFLTPKQKYFLMDELETCDDDVKLSSIQAVLDMNRILNNTKLN